MPTQVTPLSYPELAPDQRDRLTRATTAIAADMSGGTALLDPAIAPLRAPPRPVFAQAVTAECPPGDYGAVHHGLSLAPAGTVLVVAAGGRMTHAMIGGLLGGFARRKGLAGVIIDGPVRDVEELAAFEDLLVCARGTMPRGPESATGGRVGVPVRIGAVTIAPGDGVIVDADGIGVIPAADLPGLADRADRTAAAEAQHAERLAGGATTVEVFGIAPAVIG